MDNYITKLLGLRDILVKDFKEDCFSISLNIHTAPKSSRCPCCGALVSQVHDYRTQKVKDLPFRNKPVYLFLRKRSYSCNCGKRFFEKYDFLPRCHHMTQRVYESILHELRGNISMKSVAERFSVSSNTVSRVFGIVNYSLHKLPEVWAIDEFKGNTDNEKYQCILTNPHRHEILNIMPTRERTALFDYFNCFKERNHVKLFINAWECSTICVNQINNPCHFYVCAFHSEVIQSDL